MKKSLTVKEVADILNCSTRKVYYLVASSKFQCFKIGASLRIVSGSVHEYIDRQIEAYEN